MFASDVRDQSRHALASEERIEQVDGRAHVKYDRSGAGFFDHVNIGYSFLSQREERVNQGGNGNPRAVINHEYERTSAHGLQALAAKRWGRHELLLGGEAYREDVNAPSFGFNPVTGAVSVRRGRVPDEVTYGSNAVYVQDAWETVPERLRLIGGLRYSSSSYRARSEDSPMVGGAPLWPDDALDLSDVTFRLGAVASPSSRLRLSAAVSRGFRAPHITDLGTLGLTGSGFEVAALEAAALGGTVGTSAARTAASTGDRVQKPGPERSFLFEVGARWRKGAVDTAANVFVNNIRDNIAKQALVLPPGAVGTRLGDQTVIHQEPGGVVFVPASSSPVLVQANFDDARLWGIEHTFDFRKGPWTVSTIATYLRNRDIRTDRPPNIEGGTPAPDAYLHVRWTSPGGRAWIEPFVHAALSQDHLSTLDLEDRRTGATRSRASIASFFNNGARARGWIGPGPDGVSGNADDVLLVTGETLARIQDRVLGLGIDAAPLFTAVPGYVTFNIRGGTRFGTRHEVVVELVNLTDRNYRGISWGIDASGRGLFARYGLRF